MKIYGSVGIIMVIMFLQSVMAQTDDTVWVCRDTGMDVMFMHVFLADTFPDNRGQFNMVDTGDAIDGRYVNFDYQFGSPRPGFAGFKLYWDNGVAQFWVAEYDSMILWHKGPLPGHKVQMVWAQGSAGCGTPINYEYFGQFMSSAQWKRESFPFPQLRGNSPQNPSPDSPFVKNGLFELRMLIYNDSSVSTSPTSEKGCLKIDNVYFLKKNAGVRNPIFANKAIGGSRYFIPKASGKVTLTIYSLQGEQLFKEPVDVTAGKKYDISQFALKNSNLPSMWIHCVQIVGQGVNITRKVVR